MSLGPTHATLPADGELLDARFFSANEEIRLFRDCGVLQSVSLRETPESYTMENAYEISNPAFGRLLTAQETLDFDEDGQAYVALSRLEGWKRM